MSQKELLGEAPSYEYPSGHLNHLTVDQEQALEQFKLECEQRGCYVPSRDKTKASHDDETLLRFLRARKFVPSDAVQQFSATEEWRREQDLDRWYDTIDVDEYEQTRLLYTMWTGRRDKRGIPLYVLDIGGLDPSKMAKDERAAGKPEAAGKIPVKLRRLFATYEHLTNFVMPLCSSIPSQAYPETPISQTCNIVDISGVTIRQFWGLKTHLQDASTLATAHYPETLGRTFIIGAPYFFPTIWSWLKRWFDPITVSKIFIVSASEMEATLKQFIETSDLPRRFGGTLDWEFGQVPDLDPEILKIMEMKDGAVTIPKGPIRWKVNRNSDKVEAHALGSIAGKQRDDVIAEMPSALFASSFVSAYM